MYAKGLALKFYEDGYQLDGIMVELRHTCILLGCYHTIYEIRFTGMYVRFTPK